MKSSNFSRSSRPLVLVKRIFVCWQSLFISIWSSKSRLQSQKNEKKIDDDSLIAYKYEIEFVESPADRYAKVSLHSLHILRDRGSMEK